MLNEIEEAVVARLKDSASGLSADDSKLWYVPGEHIKREPPDLRQGLSGVLPAVCFTNIDFAVEEIPFEGTGEIRVVNRDSLTGWRRLKFNLLYRLDIWAGDIDSVSEIAEKALSILLTAKEQLLGVKDGHQVVEIKLVAGRSVPEEEGGIFRRQLDYLVEGELITETPITSIKEVAIKKVEWKVGEGM